MHIKLCIIRPNKLIWCIGVVQIADKFQMIQISDTESLRKLAHCLHELQKNTALLVRENGYFVRFYRGARGN